MVVVQHPLVAEQPADVKTAAAFLGCSISMVYKLLGNGELHGRRVGRKHVIDWDELRRYVNRDAD